MKLTNAELLARVVDGVITINDALTVDGNIIVPGKTLVVAGNIVAWDINAGDIDALDINAGNIDAWDIVAGNIDARNIDARNIDAGNIDALDIDYYAFCVACDSITATSIAGRRENCFYKTLDGKITIKKQGEEK